MTRNTETEAEIAPEGYTLVWSDEFNGDSLDTSKWSYQIGDGGNYGLTNWGNGEEQYYTDRAENVSVADGMLSIKVLQEDYEGYSFTSGRIRTMEDDGNVLFATTYGRVEAKIKMDGGSGIWPAFWMLPTDLSIYGKWAASGELDIMEARGRLPEQVAGTAHYGEQWPNNSYSGEEYNFPSGENIHDFHVYAIEWEPDSIRWYVDDECYFELNNWYAKGPGYETEYTSPAPFDVPFYILLNVAVGGNFDPQGMANKNSFPAEMLVDYVRVYHKDVGYDAAEAEQNAKGTQHTNAGKVHANGNLIYNYSFDQGPNRVDYWTIDGMNACVSSQDYERQLEIPEGTTDGILSQTGLHFDENAEYGMKFMCSAGQGEIIQVQVLDAENNVIASNEFNTENEDHYVYAFKFVSSQSVDGGTLLICFKNSEKLYVDDVVLLKIGDV